jgi:hypothetical protein
MRASRASSTSPGCSIDRELIGSVRRQFFRRIVSSRRKQQNQSWRKGQGRNCWDLSPRFYSRHPTGFRIGDVQTRFIRRDITPQSNRSVPAMLKMTERSWLKIEISVSQDGKLRGWIEVVSLHCIMMLCQLTNDPLHTGHSLARGLD